MNRGARAIWPRGSTYSIPKKEGNVNDDRNCVNCGTLIKAQAREKPVNCPIKKCSMPLILRDGKFDDNGWGRCLNCDSFTREEFSYCQNCGKGNAAAIERKRRFEQIKVEKERIEKDAKIRKLTVDNEQMLKRLEELEAQVKRANEEKDIEDNMLLLADNSSAKTPSSEG